MAIKQKTSVMLNVSGDCPSHSLSNISVRDITFAIDEPNERGGTNTGPTPTDTAIAALVGCTNVIGHKCAKKLGIELGHLSIDAKCEFDRRGVMLHEDIDVPFKKIVLTVKTSGTATQAELDRVAAEVNNYCPLSKLFRQAGTQIEEYWQPA
ncbi:MAG: OsmC family protein [Gammaproteobacteria bacterium]|nr:OsmC family protein [Gammaproteobacteria bacterium]